MTIVVEVASGLLTGSLGEANQTQSPVDVVPTKGNTNGDPSPPDVCERNVTLPDAGVTTPRTFELGERVFARFEKFHGIACASRNRVPISRPRREAPVELLEIGNGIIAGFMPERLLNGKQYLSRLNATVYAVARAIASVADEMDADPDVVGKKCTLKEALELRSTLLSFVTTLSAEVNRRQALKRGLGGGKRPCRKYIELAEVYGSTLPRVRCTYEAQIRNLEGSKRQSVRRRGFPVVVRERADRPDEVPVTSVRKYWQPIVGEARPFGSRKMVPTWLCQGRIVLIPKEVEEGQSTRGRRDFRPIACLNTCYKILAASISAHVLRIIDDRFLQEQIALRKGVWGCTHAQILDQTVVKDVLRHKKELHMLWVDLTKAFDSLSHGAIRWTIKLWGVSSDVRRLLSTIMSMQSVRYYGFKNGKVVTSSRLQIRNGLMQDDTLTPLLFCLDIVPISHWIRSYVRPYESRIGSGNRSDGTLTVGHILHMDDLKLFTPDSGDMALAERGIRRLFGQLGLGLLVVHESARRDVKLHPDCPVQLDDIPILGASELYKYLGARHVRLSMNLGMSSYFDLTVRQKINGYNQVVIPKLKYAISCVIFGAGKFSTLKKRAFRFDVDICKLMEESRIRFESSCTARLYVDKELGGLGMKSVVKEPEKCITYSWCYLSTNTDLLVSYELAESFRRSTKRPLTCDFLRVLASNGMDGRVKRNVLATIPAGSQTFFNATEAARAITALIRARWAKAHLTAWKSKEVAGVLKEQGRTEEEATGLCLEDSLLWSSRGCASSVVLRNVWEFRRDRYSRDAAWPTEPASLTLEGSVECNIHPTPWRLLNILFRRVATGGLTSWSKDTMMLHVCFTLH
ncbi:hypothetical protein Aduo_001451 [Ancylostoma duodenale]